MPPNTNAVLERPALYYPYIHIRDANWLKATLLCFGQVRRIVPQDFELNDSLAVRRFRDLKGNGGEPLLADEPASSEAVYHAQERLLERVSALPAKELKRFSRSATERDLEGDVEKFQIHRGKMHSLLDFFVSRELAWPSRGVKSEDAAEWFALHPKLGEAVMSVIAIAIARDKGLDVVTSDGSVHRALATLDEDAVLSQLSGLPFAPAPAPPNVGEANTVDELVQTVMTTALDPGRLTAEQVAELIRDGKDLRAFRAEVATFAQAIPDISDPGERKKRLHAKAGEVIEKWEEHKKSLPKFALEAVISATDYKTPELVAAIVGASSFTLAGTGVGLAIGLATFAGFRIWRGYKEKASSPY